jgi:hypothetical protein
MNIGSDSILARLDRLELEDAAIRRENAAIRQEDAAIRSENAATRALLSASERRNHTERRRYRVQMGFALCSIVAAILLFPAIRPARADDDEKNTLKQLLARVIALESKTQDALARLTTVESKTQDALARVTTVESKTQYVSVDTTKQIMVITGANLQIVNGLGATNGNPLSPTALDPAHTVTNGLGNLIVGYNEIDAFSPSQRGGSHNLVIGNFNSYSSYGGFVAGQLNSIIAPFAAVSGGTKNTASSQFASVSGGFANFATGIDASVSGGSDNTASGEASSVSGGSFNLASGILSSVSGGGFNIASGFAASISGGSENIAIGDVSSVSGGARNTQSDITGWSGGTFHSP